MPRPGERVPLGFEERPPVLLILPGSRGGEIDRMLGVFGEAIGLLAENGIRFEPIIPAVPRLSDRIRQETASWAVRPAIVTGEAEKFAAFRRAHAALATSGTVTLELALAGVPMVVAYRRDWIFRLVTDVVRKIPGQVQVTSMVLANIILGRNVVPDHLDPKVTPGLLAADLLPLLAGTEERDRQVEGFKELWTKMALPEGERAADIAAGIVLDLARAGRTKP